MTPLAAWLDPVACPETLPPLDAMSSATRALHEAIDAHARRSGRAYLHPAEPTVQLDLLGSAAVVAWQEGKGAALFAGEQCWSDLPPLYARYGTGATAELMARLRDLEQARVALVCESGMQVTALTFDVLLTPGRHAVLMRQVYNKTKSYLTWLADRVGGAITIVDDGNLAALEAAIRPETALVFCETFTNPLVRAQDVPALVSLVAAARSRAPDVRLIVDSTIATPWAFAAPLLQQGVDVVIASGTKALSGTDRDLWGYIATNDVRFGNGVMDLMAMRGGILDWRRASAILGGLDGAEAAHARRSATAVRVADFLGRHPRVSEVFHPSRSEHPDAVVIARHYRRHGSLLSFRVAGADEAATRHVADVMAMTTVIRYALSFDGPVTKVNHHQTVSEYFTPLPDLRRSGFDRLIRLAVGLEEADDLIAALNWALHNAARVTTEEVLAWQRGRLRARAGSASQPQ